MKKNAFTLVELLGVIVLITVISFLAFPTILNQIKKSKIGINKTVEQIVINSAKSYISDNQDYFPENSNYNYCIKIQKLIDLNYLDKDALSSSNNQYLDKYIKVNYDTNYNYDIVDESSCIVCRKINTTTYTYYTKSGQVSSTYNVGKSSLDIGYTYSCKVKESNPTDTNTNFLFSIFSKDSNSGIVNLISHSSQGSNVSFPAYETALNSSTTSWKIKPRIISVEEVEKLTSATRSTVNDAQISDGGTDEDSSYISSDYSWLYANLSSPGGIWTSSSISGFAYYISSKGKIALTNTSTTTNMQLMPVISISQSQIES